MSKRASEARAAADDLATLLHSMRESKPGADDSFSVIELCRRTGRGTEWVRNRLREAKERGEIDLVPIRRETLDGRMVETTGYRLKVKGKL